MKISELIENELQDPEFAKAYEEEGERLETALTLYRAREAAGLTQKELATRAHTTQATIARIENGQNVSVDKMAQLAQALGKKLRVEFV